jgi:hypothetical protein
VNREEALGECRPVTMKRRLLFMLLFLALLVLAAGGWAAQSLRPLRRPLPA